MFKTCSQICLFGLFVLLCFLPSRAHSGPIEALEKHYIRILPDQVEDLRFFLRTVGRGNSLYMTGGHSILRIVDYKRGVDVSYNWGVFDFSRQDFLLEFMTGDIQYRLLAYPSQSDLSVYRKERRSLFEQEIFLTNEQKKKLMTAIVEASAPNAIFFRYHYFFSNCATKILDVLDFAVDGQLKIFLSSIQTQRTIRSSVRESFKAFPFVEHLLEIVMNKEIDKEMSAQEDSFLPWMMQRWLSEMPFIGDDGLLVTSAKFLSAPIILLTYPEPQRSLFGPDVIGWCVLLGIVVVWLMLHSWTRACQLWFKLCWSSYWIVSGLLGCLMALIWLVTTHEHGHSNANLLVFFPWDFVMLGGLSANKLVVGWRKFGSILVRWNLCLHLIGLIVCLSLQIVDGHFQDQSRVLPLYGSFLVVFLIGLINTKRQPRLNE